jgi:hypothetical protein
MRRMFGRVSAIAFALMLGTSVAAKADTLTGSFNLGSLVDVTVTANTIAWGANGAGFNQIFNSATDDFAFLASTSATLDDLAFPPDAVGVPISHNEFLSGGTIPAGWDFNLTMINNGFGSALECTNNVGDTCTFPGSPFTITNTLGGGSSITLQLAGTLSDGSGDPVSNWVATFTTQFNGLTAAEIGAIISAPGGSITNSHSSTWDVTFTPTEVPEPASMLLLGGGLAAVSAIRRRAGKKSV